MRLTLRYAPGNDVKKRFHMLGFLLFFYIMPFFIQRTKYRKINKIHIEFKRFIFYIIFENQNTSLKYGTSLEMRLEKK